MVNRKQVLKRIKVLYRKKLDVPQELADAIREANAQGITYNEIAAELGIGKTGVSQIVARRK